MYNIIKIIIIQLQKLKGQLTVLRNLVSEDKGVCTNCFYDNKEFFCRK